MDARELIRIEYPDDDLRQRICRYLGSRHFPAFRNLEIDVENGSVTLHGTVCSYYEKQVALDTCRRVAGVLSTIDNISVDRAPLPTAEPGTMNLTPTGLAVAATGSCFDSSAHLTPTKPR